MIKTSITALALGLLLMNSAATHADGTDAKVTIVYEHELPNVPGKSIKGILVEYGPGGSSPEIGRAHV